MIIKITALKQKKILKSVIGHQIISRGDAKEGMMT